MSERNDKRIAFQLRSSYGYTCHITVEEAAVDGGR